MADELPPPPTPDAGSAFGGPPPSDAPVPPAPDAGSASEAPAAGGAPVPPAPPLPATDTSTPGPPLPPPPTADEADAPITDGERPRWVLPVVIVGVVVALLLAVGVIVAIASDSSSEEYSFDAAMSGLSDASAVDFDLQLTAGGAGELNLSGAATDDLLAVTFDDEGAGGEEAEQLIVDSGEGVVYLHVGELLPTLGLDLPFGLDVLPDAGWLSVDLGSLLDEPLGLTERLGELGQGADEVTEVGDDEIDGEPVRHYEVTIDVGDRLSELGQIGEILRQFGLDDALEEGRVGDSLGKITYDVWVTEDNQPRRLAFVVGPGDRQVSMVVDVVALDDDVEIVVPGEDEVFELPGLFGD
jgi:hypothetical protein